MRIALLLIAALVSSVVLSTEPAAARPRGDQVAEAKKVKTKRKAKVAKAKPAKKKSKATRVAKAEKADEEEAPVVHDEPAPEPERKVAAPAPVSRGARASQAVDDEVPRNEPKKR